MRQETPYGTEIERIESGVIEVLEHDVKYEIQGGTSMAYHKDQNDETEYWREVLPNSSQIRRLEIVEKHKIPFTAHLGVSRTVSKVCNSFYWKDLFEILEHLLRLVLCINWGNLTIRCLKDNSNFHRFQKLNGGNLA